MRSDFHIYELSSLFFLSQLIKLLIAEIFLSPVELLARAFADKKKLPAANKTDLLMLRSYNSNHCALKLIRYMCRLSVHSQFTFSIDIQCLAQVLVL